MTPMPASVELFFEREFLGIEVRSQSDHACIFVGCRCGVASIQSIAGLALRVLSATSSLDEMTEHPRILEVAGYGIKTR